MSVSGKLYDQTAPNAQDLMVTKQGGTLRAIATPPAWHNTQYNGNPITWGLNLRLDKTVSRPWVEWQYDVLSGASAEEAPLPLPPDYSGPSLLAKDQERQITFRYLDTNANAAFPAQVAVSFADSTVGTVAPSSIVVNGSNVPGLKFSIKATEETLSGQPARLNVQVTYANGQSRTLYQIPVYAFTSGMAVDYNRDGEMHFHDEPGNPKAGTDDVPDGKYYEFWLNDDHDAPGDGGVQDDLNDGYKDNQFKTIPYLRGLEDYTRLWIKTLSGAAAGGQRLTYALRFDGSSAQGVPSIQLFRATDNDGGLGYLQDVTAGQMQLSTSQDSHYAGDVLTATRGQWLFVDPAGTNGHFIFGGGAAGSAPLVLVIQQGGLTIARHQLPMNLRPITDFYEEYTVGNSTDDPAGGISTSPTHDLGRDSTHASVQGNDYILYVHGWNMEGVTHKERWAETAYKRLWWLGYKGRFGLFRWPSLDLGSTFWTLFDSARARGFDQSEYNAWLSGTGLKSLLVQLKGKGYTLNVLAHSQGNITMAQALREAADQHLVAPLVISYVASQAAVSGSLYNASAVNAFTGRGMQPTTPIDSLGHYVASNPQGDSTKPPYMEGTVGYCDKWIDFYNNEDYAVGDDTSFQLAYGMEETESAWEYNNVHFRPWNVGPQDTIYWYDDQSWAFKENSRALDPGNPSDRFLIFSTAAQSWGVTIGAVPVAQFSDENNSMYLVNLAMDLKDGPVNQTLHNDHYEHDGQFMYALPQRWIYWYKLLRNIGLQPQPWMRSETP